MRGLEGEAEFRRALADGTLPAVSFLDPGAEDEHPPSDVQRGERWTRSYYQLVTRSPLWPSMALFLTYDEGGGFFDRDANADGLLDLFDFSKPELLHPPSAPPAGRRGCKPVAVARR